MSVIAMLDLLAYGDILALVTSTCVLVNTVSSCRFLVPPGVSSLSTECCVADTVAMSHAGTKRPSKISQSLNLSISLSSRWRSILGARGAE
jgi:hypothetical protein